MPHRFRATLLSLVIWLISYGQAIETVVVDSITSLPLSHASIFDKNGNIAGICTDEGKLPPISPSAYPLTIRFIGYHPAIVHNSNTDSIFMKEAVTELPEVIVESKKRQVLHLIGYVREYSTLATYTDTILLFREKIVDFMVPSKKIKKFRGWITPRLLASESYYRFSDAGGNDSVSDYFPEHFSWADWIGIFRQIQVPEKISSSSNICDTILGNMENHLYGKKRTIE